MKSPQLPLPISLPADETFVSFYPGDNHLLLSALKTALLDESFHSFYLWSAMPSGKTHLLYSICNDYAEKGKSIAYIPLEQYCQESPAILIGLENNDLICLDNIHAIANSPLWQEAIFDLFNKLHESNNKKLVITSHFAPKQSQIDLPDLISRLEWGQVYQLKELSDEEKITALQLRASLKGFDLPTDVCAYLLKRVGRDMRTLCGLLEKIDIATITEQRKITIPFIKNIFGL